MSINQIIGNALSKRGSEIETYDLTVYGDIYNNSLNDENGLVLQINNDGFAKFTGSMAVNNLQLTRSNFITQAVNSNSITFLTFNPISPNPFCSGVGTNINFSITGTYWLNFKIYPDSLISPNNGNFNFTPYINGIANPSFSRYFVASTYNSVSSITGDIILTIIAGDNLSFGCSTDFLKQIQLGNVNPAVSNNFCITRLTY